ncbi:MAG: hypothetical protein IIC90_09185 [Chloroflexi bacterium]|nr:hypothetical protein [Chloroflexota bacterium]
MIRIFTLLLMPGILALAIACGDDDGGDQPVPTPTVDAPAATSTPAPDGEADGADGFRQFIPAFQEALDEGDASFLRGRALTQAILCTADNVAPAGPGGPSCEFEGQEFDGFTETFWRSEGAIIPVEDAFSDFDTMLLTAKPGESDDFGDGSVQVYALNVGDNFDAIVTAIIERPADFGGEGPLRVAYGTNWVFESERWVVTSTLTAFVLGEELLEPAEVVQPLYPNWERYESP